MARLASAVHLITTDGPGGRAGFTASAVCSVSDAPPTLLVCLNRASSAYPAFARNERLCVNTLSAEQQAVAAAFGGRTPMEARFAAAAWHSDFAGVPVLDGALAGFSCRIVRRVPAGTHDVLFCEVEALADSVRRRRPGLRRPVLPRPAPRRAEVEPPGRLGAHRRTGGLSPSPEALAPGRASEPRALAFSCGTRSSAEVRHGRPRDAASFQPAREAQGQVLPPGCGDDLHPEGQAAVEPDRHGDDRQADEGDRLSEHSDIRPHRHLDAAEHEGRLAGMRRPAGRRGGEDDVDEPNSSSTASRYQRRKRWARST